MTRLTQQPAVALLHLLATRQITAVALAEEHIRRIEALDPVLHAFADFDPERVLAQARSRDAAAAGNAGAPQGLLHGLPVTVKSSISVAGHLCERGSLLYRGFRPARDAVAVERLRAAGAVILGTTACPEFLMAYETGNRLREGQQEQDTLNPWDLSRTAGGSSGGEAAAVAAGLSAGGLGSDGGGSVRIPAHFTGICALKPTPGRIPARGHLPENTGPFALLGVLGPMARTLPDVELLFRVVAGALPTDPAGAPVPLRAVSREEARAARIGYLEDDGLVPVTPETRAAVRAAAEALRAQGWVVEPCRPFPALERARELWYTLFVQGGALLLEPLTQGREEDRSRIFSDFLRIAHTASPLSATDLLAIWCELDLVRAELLREMERYPILLSPVCAIPAFRPGERAWTLPGGERLDYLNAMRFAQWWNLLGAPAVVVPVGRSPEGLPIGVQLAGRPYADELVLAVGAAVEQAFPFQPPPLLEASLNSPAEQVS